jgi:hypothetical protein
VTRVTFHWRSGHDTFDIASGASDPRAAVRLLASLQAKAKGQAPCHEVYGFRFEIWSPVPKSSMQRIAGVSGLFIVHGQGAQVMTREELSKDEHLQDVAAMLETLHHPDTSIVCVHPWMPHCIMPFEESSALLSEDGRAVIKGGAPHLQQYRQLVARMKQAEIEAAVAEARELSAEEELAELRAEEEERRAIIEGDES